MLNRNNEKGRSMVEMMGYMAVGIALVASVGRLVANAFDEYKYSRAYIQLTELVNGIVKAAAIDADYQDVVERINGQKTQDNENKEGQKLIPSSYRRIGNTLLHAFGGTVTISLPPVDSSLNLGEAVNDAEDETAHSDKLAITYEGLTRRQCIEMALKDWQNDRNVDLYAVVINSTNYWYWPIYTGLTESPDNVCNTPDNTLPVRRFCVAGDNDSKGQCNKEKGNVIMWIFN